MENNEDKLLEDLKTRELELEAIVHAMYEVFEKSQDLGEGLVGSLYAKYSLDSLMTQLYIRAGVSCDITELVKIEVEYE